MNRKLDKSYIKGKDLGLFNEVISYLENEGLSVKLRGSVSEGDRNYRDIDLCVVGGQNFKERKGEVIIELARSMNKKYALRNKIPFADNIAHYSHGNILYVNTEIDNRFTIQRGKTIIDLCFEKY